MSCLVHSSALIYLYDATGVSTSAMISLSEMVAPCQMIAPCEMVASCEMIAPCEMVASCEIRFHKNFPSASNCFFFR